jgi:exodeoxyribonuclease-3
MRIVTWNVNSLKARAEHVARFLDQVSPTVLCMQELKLEDDKVPRQLFEERGYHLVHHGQRTYNGVAIASRLPMSDVMIGLPEVEEDESRVIAATLGGLRIVNLYCPQGQSVDSPKFEYKLRFYDNLIAWLRKQDEPDLIVTGDLNIAPRACDLFDPVGWRNTPSFHPLEHQRWQRLLDLGLLDATEDWLPEGTFTFWDYRARSFDRQLGLRIDHFLVTPSVMARVQGATVHTAVRGEEKASDHAPVRLDLG